SHHRGLFSRVHPRPTVGRSTRGIGLSLDSRHEALGNDATPSRMRLRCAPARHARNAEEYAEFRAAPGSLLLSRSTPAGLLAVRLHRTVQFPHQGSLDMSDRPKISGVSASKSPSS